MSVISNILNMTTQSELEKHCQEFSIVLVDFWAPWCGPCKAMNPILEQAALAFGQSLSIVKVNIDEAQDLAASCEISSIPSLLLFVRGKHIETKVGSQSLLELKKWLEQHGVNN